LSTQRSHTTEYASGGRKTQSSMESEGIPCLQNDERVQHNHGYNISPMVM